MRFKFLLLYLLIVFLTLISCSLNYYRIKDVKNGNSKQDKFTEFLIPPKSKIANEGLFNLKKRLVFKEKSQYRYQYITIRGLSKSYISCLNSINEAVYFYQKEDADIVLREEYGIYSKPVSIGQNNLANFYSSHLNINSKNNDKINIAIRINLNQLLLEENNYVNNYKQLAFDLLSTISSFESEFLPISISQNIVEKVFELIPIPQEASLARYGYFKSSWYSIFLLNPNMVLNCDYISKVQFNNPLDDQSTIMRWEGVNNLSFYRDDYGKIKQVPYLGFDINRLPSNFIGSDSHHENGITVNYYNIAGSADLELSSKITNTKYIALYQPIFGNSNLSMDPIEGEKKRCCVNLYDCNSQIVLSNAIDEILNPQNKCKNSIPIFGNVAVYGERSFMEVFDTIYINKLPIPFPFATTIGQLKQQGYLLENFQLYRVYNGKLIEVKAKGGFSDDFTLLANDHIISQ